MDTLETRPRWADDCDGEVSWVRRKIILSLFSPQVKVHAPLLGCGSDFDSARCLKKGGEELSDVIVVGLRTKTMSGHVEPTAFFRRRGRHAGACRIIVPESRLAGE
jgi:hypothetical protein